MSGRGRWFVGVAVGWVGCGAPPPSAPGDAGGAPRDLAVVADAPLQIRGLEHVARVVRRCDGEDLAPLRTGDDIDDLRCTPVGAPRTPTPPRWPATDGLASPVVFVDPDAAPDGTGTVDAPYRAIASGLAHAPPAATIVLSRGRHLLADTARIARDLALIGAGADGGSFIELPRDRTGIAIEAPSRVALRGVTLRFTGDARTDRDVAISARGVTLSLNEVAIDDASVGVDLDGGSLDAAQLSVRGSARAGVRAGSNARISLRRFVIRDGAGQGIRAETAHVALFEGLVARMGRHGVVLLGASDGSGGRASCLGAPSAGPLDCIDQLVSQGNGVAGLYVSDPRRVEVRRSTFADTALTPIELGEAGDGVFVGGDAELSLDPELVSPAVRGFGSAIVGNARVGALAQGVRARLSVRGAVIARNASGGLFVGARAEVPVVGESLFVENRFAGIAAAPGSLVGIVQCNGIADTQAGTLRGASGTVSLADGVHINSPTGRVSLRENTILRSTAFGLLVNAGSLLLQSNRGADNRFGVGIYGGATVEGDARTIVGRERAPATAPDLAAGL